MKKNTLFAIVAMLMMSVSALAQSNTYNMVIEMANGTKINIGPNDVKNIYFNDGELVVSGENIEKLVKTNRDEILKLQAQIDYLADALKKTQDGSATMEDIEALKAKIAYLENQTDGVNSNEIKNLQAQINDMAAVLKKTQDGSATMEDIEALKAKIAYLENQTDGVNSNEIKNLQAQINDMAAVLKKTQDGSATMEDIEALKAKIAYLENQTNGVNINIIQDLQAQIHYLTKILKDHGIE